MRLTDLIARSAPPGQAHPGLDEGIDSIDITGLTADSRAVQPGYLFAAFSGAKLSGADFVNEARSRGAVAVLATSDIDAGGLIKIDDECPRRRFSHMAAVYHGVQPDIVAAVTGTSGKSSTVSFARQIWEALGISAASLGTLGVESTVLNRYAGLTTADPVALHADLADLAATGIVRAAMEASSHGLDQFRLDGVQVKVAGFTSFGRDHLDYHETVTAYFAAKRRLFAEVLIPGGVAVLNADIPEFDALRDAALVNGRRILTYGCRGFDLRILSQTPVASGQTVKLAVGPRDFEFNFPLVGEFQLMNALCALGMVAASEIADLSQLSADLRFGGMIDALQTLRGVRGRLEHVADTSSGGAIFVDYAHKPDALVAVLDALRPHARGRLIVVFGCGGDRDAGKRPIMGEIATRLADVVIVTDDNPRGEDPAHIRAQILAAAPDAIEIADRASAIAAGIHLLTAGDVLVIAGKGHEQGQIVGGSILPFDDAEVARAAVSGAAP